MEEVIHRVGSQWYRNGQLIRFDVLIALGRGWTYTLSRSRRKNQHHLEVHHRGERIYRCNITEASFVLVTSKGAVGLTEDNARYRELARKIVEALSRHRQPVYAQLAFLHDQTISGTTLRTQLGLRNNFSDGTWDTLSSAQRRIIQRCEGGTYLVRVLRHDNLRIYAANIIVQADYNEEHLLQTLRNLA